MVFARGSRGRRWRRVIGRGIVQSDRYSRIPILDAEAKMSKAQCGQATRYNMHHVNTRCCELGRKAEFRSVSKADEVGL